MTADPTDRLNTALQGRYTIGRELGQGGMATVYLAHDVRHDRQVALKVLKPELAAVIGAERFLAEIKTTANLQHPHILPLFDSGEADGFLFYVMPFVRGESLRDRIDREKQLGVEESVAITRKVADALDYAHGLGVVHRDIKPANVLLSERGEPLVADFGIALAVAQAGGGRITETGLSLGTPHYMSPEQATGDREIDPRSDVYALGCVLYEMLAGQPPFAAPTAQAVLVRVLTTDVTPVTSLRRTVPPHVESVLAKSLEKLPADRFSTAAEFSRALTDEGFAYEVRPLAGASQAAPAASATSARPWIRERSSLASLGVIAILGTLAAWGWLRPAPPPPPVHATRSLLDLGDIEVGIREEIAVSPDGSRFAVVGTVEGQNAVYWRNASEDRFRAIPGTEDAREGVSFSPDGDWLVYATFNPDGLKKVSLAGGAPTPVVPASRGISPRLPHWGDDGTIVFTGPSGLFRVADTGGEPELISAGFLSPTILPGGRGILAARDGGGALVIDPVTDSTRELTSDGIDPHYVETGHIVYADASGGLWARPFDLEGLQVTGDGVPLFDGLSIVNWGPSNVARFKVSRNGTLVYGSGLRAGAASLNLTMYVVDLDGNETPVPLEPRPFLVPRWSPDGRTIAYASGGDGSQRNLYTYDVELRSTPRQITVQGDNQRPMWSPDGSRLVFSSARGDGEWDLYVKSILDDAAPELLVSLPGPQWPTQWPSEDIVVFEHGSGAQDLWMVDLSTTPAEARPYYESESDLDEVRVSPDGTLAAYTTEETGREEIFVSSFPERRQPTPVSQGTAEFPLWGPDGRTLYFQSYAGDRRLVAARVDPGPPFVVTSLDTLFPWPYEPSSAHVHPDGDRFIATRMSGVAGPDGLDDGEPERFVVVVNWFEELLERMGEGN